MTRAKKLRDLMSDHNLTCVQVGRMLDRQPQTVRAWRTDGGRQIPAQLLELLTLVLR